MTGTVGDEGQGWMSVQIVDDDDEEQCMLEFITLYQTARLSLEDRQKPPI